MTAERWLLEEARNEPMVLHVIHVLLLECTFATAVAKRQLVVLVVILRNILVVSHRRLSLTAFQLSTQKL